MAKKKKKPSPKKKDTPQVFPVDEEKKETVEDNVVVGEEEKALVSPIIECSCVGKVFTPASSNFKGKCVKQRWVENLQMSLLYFEGGVGPYNATICRLEEEGENSGKKNNSKD